MRLSPIPLFAGVITLALLILRGGPLLVAGADKRAHLPARTSRGHHTFENACEACHTPFQGVTNEACLRCHGQGLEAAEDSHPESKFADPRNADRVAGLDARACVTCHVEHVPDRTRSIGVTLPADFCAACHEDIGRDRPSHASFSFGSCASAGCHRFHDNRGLYEGFLARHLHEPENLADAGVPSLTASKPSGPALSAGEADAPPEARPEAAMREWAASAHARAGVNCTACHAARDAGGVWKDRCGSDSCGGCHSLEHASFERGVHGVRAALHLSPLTAGEARLPMRGDAHGKALDCHACHGAHDYDTRKAAVDGCLGCHDDPHSRAYAATRHARAWAKEQAGAAAKGSGVSCATCHMPRAQRRSKTGTEVSATHDVSAALRPGEKMVRAACLGCHGLGFALDALADADLAGRCFNGRPAVHVESLTMVERRGGKGR